MVELQANCAAAAVPACSNASSALLQPGVATALQGPVLLLLMHQHSTCLTFASHIQQAVGMYMHVDLSSKPYKHSRAPALLHLLLA